MRPGLRPFRIRRRRFRITAQDSTEQDDLKSSPKPANAEDAGKRYGFRRSAGTLGAAIFAAWLASGGAGSGDGAALGALSRGAEDWRRIWARGIPRGTCRSFRSAFGMMRDLVPEDRPRCCHRGVSSWTCWRFVAGELLLCTADARMGGALVENGLCREPLSPEVSARLPELARPLKAMR